MAQRFPNEPVPTFDARYRELPEVILAYTYLNVNVAFEHPFYVNKKAFSFHDSNGCSTEVTSFQTRDRRLFVDTSLVRRQVEILCYHGGESRNAPEFAVDLCKQTRPYQIVLARVPRGRTLGETVTLAEQRIAEFRNDPNYEHLHTISNQDRLIVPDVAYALTHHFEELVGEYFQNQAWQGHFIFDAREVIDFALTRTGLILKSEGRFGAAAGIRTSHEPRRLYFDRPFLIYVRKRGANAPPFFVMWVDNAELMQPYDASARADSSRP